MKGAREKVLSFGILFISTALVFVSIFLLIKSKGVNNTESKEESLETEISLETDKLGKKTYVDEKFGYSMSYPKLLEPRSITSDDFLSFIIFFVPEGIKGDGFAISVRENNLDNEKELIKEQMEKEGEMIKIEESAININGDTGIKLVFKPDDKLKYEDRGVAIFGKGIYAYSISARPELLDGIISDFKFLD